MDAVTGQQRRARTKLVALILLCAAALLLLLWNVLRDSGVLGGGTHLAESAFTYSAGGSPCFDAAGSGLAVSSTTGLALFDGTGARRAEDVFSSDTPACSGSAELSVFYDVGAYGLRAVGADGKVRTLDTDGPVIFADVNEAGVLAVTSEYAGYKGCVVVYDKKLSPLFRWDSGSAWPVTARVSPEDILCVNCTAAGGSVLRFFRMDQETELGSYAADGELILDFGFLNGGVTAAVTETRLILLDKTGQEISTWSLEGRYLTGYWLDGAFAALVTSPYHSGGGAIITCLDPDSGLLGELDTGREVTALSAAGKRLLVLYPDEATLYTDQLREIVSYQKVQNVKQIFLRADGTALLAGAYGADCIDFG